MKTVRTPKGTELPLISLKGKDYLQVAHRIQWLNEVVENFTITTDVIKAEKDESIVKATVTIFSPEVDATGGFKILRKVSATKREDSKGFADHLEKAETGSIGRCLALCGFGTQFAVSDLDEGDRIVDSPVTNLKSAQTVVPVKMSTIEANITPAAKQAEEVIATVVASSTVPKIKVPSPFKAKPKTTGASANDGI